MEKEALQQVPPAVQMLQMITAAWLSQSIYVAAKLGIADQLKDKAKHIKDLSADNEVNTDSLYRIMRALASVGIFTEESSQVFGLTPLANVLLSDKEGSMRNLAIMCGEEPFKSWGNIFYSVKTGKPSFEDVYKVPLFEYLSHNSKSAETFNAAMTDFATQMHTAILQTYDFSRYKKVVDVGGGHGLLIKAILAANPHLQGILFDLPHVVAGAKANIEKASLLERCEIVGGNFFESVPSGGDLYILSTVIHDWDDEKALHILQNCHKAMNSDAKLALVEMVIPEQDYPFFGKFLDLNMMVMVGGRERTQSQYQSLYEKASFNLSNIISTPSPMSLIEGDYV